jgi:hypothetical protein
MNPILGSLRFPQVQFADVRLLAGLTACVVLAGCMTAKVDETRQAASAVQRGESIVVLRKPQIEGTGTEDEFLGCLQDRLGGDVVHPDKGQSTKAHKNSPFKIYGAQQFEDALFPWFESSTAPSNAAGLKLLLQRPGVTERLQEIQVRYIVWVDGKTHTSDSNGSIACAIGPGIGGCIGLGWWDKQSGYVASVWDLNTATEIGSVSTDVVGTSVLIGAIAPIPIITPVRKTACDRLGDQLRSFLVGGGVEAGAAGTTGAGSASGGSAGSR